MKQRYGNKDANHNQVVQWYRELGCSVAETHDACLGVPDLYIGCCGLTDPVEVKTEDGDLRPSQRNFIASWRGSPVWIIRTQNEVIEHVNHMRKRARKAA